MDVSIDIIIPTFNRGTSALQLAEQLAGQCGPKDTITIVHQGPSPTFSIPPTINFLTSSPPNLPRARNKGITNTHGDIVLFLDDDVVPMPGLIEAHRTAYAVNPSIGGVAGFIDDPLFDKNIAVPSTFHEETGELIQQFSVLQSQETISVMGANMSFKRSALNTAGLFDERFSRNALWEEIDLAFRLRKAGYEIWYNADAKVRHIRKSSGGCRQDIGLRYIYHQFANTAFFYAKHAPKAYRSQWRRFYWYRLEYLSRMQSGFLKHGPLIVAAGIIGACAGMIRNMHS